MATITPCQGNLLACDAEALVNTVNCVGVMGKGIALAFKKAYPENFTAYAQACRRGDVRPGRVFVCDAPASELIGPLLLLNVPTKRHWRDPSRLSDVEAGIADLVRVCREREIESIAIPPLGCGNGGLDWRVVRPKIVRALSTLPDLTVYLYDPPGFVPPRAPEPASRRSFSPPF